MHLRSLDKQRVDWIDWLAAKPVSFWIIGLLPACDHLFSGSFGPEKTGCRSAFVSNFEFAAFS